MRLKTQNGKNSIQLNLKPNKEPQGTNIKVTKENGPHFGKSNFGFM